MKFKQASIYILPSFIGLAVFYMIPFFGSINYSFLSSGFNPEWVGFDNFVKLFGSDLFRLSLNNTLVFTFTMVPLIVILSLILAVFTLNDNMFCRLFRSSMVIPYMLPTASLVLLWMMFFNKAGPINWILSLVGIDKIDWLAGGFMRWPIMFMYMWKNLGFNVIILFASLNTIPVEILESSKLDGAGWFTRLFRIILPQITPTLFFVAVISLINSLKIFKEAYLLSGAHPDKTAYTLQHFINNQFKLLRYNWVVTASVILVIIIYILVLILFRVEHRMRN